jgi:DNA polymerase (family 10)
LRADHVERQHAEIDAANRRHDDFRVLKGVEADILADGSLDYGPAVLDRFDFVIASIHTRFGMTEADMTARVLRALDDPHMTILGHPTGRLLLAREPYAIDLERVLERAAQRGVAVELNADPHRLDLDWRMVRGARDRGVPISLGADAHSIAGMTNVALGVAIARKGWLGADDVLNTRDAEGFLAHARRRRHAYV